MATIPDEETRTKFGPVSGTGPFAFSFTYFAKADLTVYVDGVDLGQGGFTESGTPFGDGVGFDGGSVTLVSSVTNATVVIERNIPTIRTEDLSSGPLDIDDLNSEFDRNTAQLQDLTRRANRSIELPVDEDTPAEVFRFPSVTARANKVLGFDASGNPIATTSSGGGGAVDSVVGLTGTITKTQLLTAINVEDGATGDLTGAEIAALLDIELGSAAWQSGGGAPTDVTYPEDHSAVGDGVADDTTAISNWLQHAHDNNKLAVATGGKTYLIEAISKTLTNDLYVEMRGESVIKGKAGPEYTIVSIADAGAGDLAITLSGAHTLQVGERVRFFDDLTNSAYKGKTGDILAVDQGAGTLTVDAGTGIAGQEVGSFAGTDTGTLTNEKFTQPMLTFDGAANDPSVFWDGGEVNNSLKQHIANVSSSTGVVLKRIDFGRFDGVKFHSTADWNDQKGDAGLAPEECNRILVDNCWFRGQPDVALYFTGSATGVGGKYIVRNSHFESNQIGVTYRREPAYVAAIGCTFENESVHIQSAEASGGGAGLNGAEEVMFVANIMKDAGKRAIDVRHAKKGVIANNDIENWVQTDAVTNWPAIHVLGCVGLSINTNTLKQTSNPQGHNTIGVSIADHNPGGTGNIVSDENYCGGNVVQGVHTPFRSVASGQQYAGVNHITGATDPYVGFTRFIHQTATGLGVNIEAPATPLHVSGAIRAARDIEASQNIEIVSDAVGSQIISRSLASTAKKMVLHSKTDDAHTAPTGGLLGFTFLINNTDAVNLLTDRAEFGNRYVELQEISSPATPPANSGYVYLKDNGAGSTIIVMMDSTGTEFTLGGVTGSGTVNSVFGRTGAVTAAASDYDASQIDFTPAGTIAATNVQAAIEEVANEAAGGGAANWRDFVDQGATPANPPAGQRRLYTESLGGVGAVTLSILDSAGGVTRIGRGIDNNNLLTFDERGGDPPNPTADKLHVYAKDNGGGVTKLYAKDSSGTVTDLLAGAGGGEANTASSVGVAGVSVFKQKTGINLEFNSINAASSMVSVALDAVNNEVDVNVVPGQIDINALLNAGSLAAKNTVATGDIDAGAVTLARMADMATDSFVGRDTAGTGSPEILSPAAARTILNVEDGADVTDATNVAAAGAVMDSDISAAEGFLRKTGAGAYEAIKSNLAASVAPGATDDSAAGYGVGSRWIDTTADKEYVCVDATATAAVWVETTQASGGVSDGDKGDITVSGSGATWAIDDEAVTLAKLAHMATASILGRNAAGAGDVEVLSASTVRAILNVADGANNYSHPNHTGDVTSAGDGATTIANNAVTNAKAADMAANTIKGRKEATTGDPEDIGVASLTEELTPAAGDFLIGWESGGGFRKFNTSHFLGGGGEVNTASNVGVGGVSVFDAKVGADLQFRSIGSPSGSLITAALDAPNKKVDIDVASGSLATKLSTDTKTTPLDDDYIFGADPDNAADALKEFGITWNNAWGYFQTKANAVYEPLNAALLKSDATATLTKWFTHTTLDLGNIDSVQTVTPVIGDRALVQYQNNSAHTLDPPASGDGWLYLEITNGATAGAITVSNFTQVIGAAPSTTNGEINTALIFKRGANSTLFWLSGLVIGTDVQAHSAVLDATTASFTTADETKLDGIEAGATADQSNAEIQTAYNAQVQQVSQADAEAGTISSDRRWTPERVKQAIKKLAPVSLVIACSDETTDLTTGTAKVTFRMPHAMTLTAVRASVTTAPTGSTLIADINEGGVSILSTKLSIDAGEKTSVTAAAAPVISDAALADDAEITVDIDQIGSTVAGAGLKVYLIGTPA